MPWTVYVDDKPIPGADRIDLEAKAEVTIWILDASTAVLTASRRLEVVWTDDIELERQPEERSVL